MTSNHEKHEGTRYCMELRTLEPGHDELRTLDPGDDGRQQLSFCPNLFVAVPDDVPSTTIPISTVGVPSPPPTGKIQFPPTFLSHLKVSVPLNNDYYCQDEGAASAYEQEAKAGKEALAWKSEAAPANKDDVHKFFPDLLFTLLADEINSDCISWLPHGRTFKITNRDKFLCEALSRYGLKQTKYASFTRKLSRWEFVRIIRGADAGSFYNKLFQRDRPELRKQMFCKGERPQFARMSTLVAPFGYHDPYWAKAHENVLRRSWEAKSGLTVRPPAYPHLPSPNFGPSDESDYSLINDPPLVMPSVHYPYFIRSNPDSGKRAQIGLAKTYANSPNVPPTPQLIHQTCRPSKHHEKLSPSSLIHLDVPDDVSKDNDSDDVTKTFASPALLTFRNNSVEGIESKK